LVTIRDIAKHAGVSVATVSHVINSSRRVGAERKDRILRAIEELNYVPNAVARGLRVRETRTLGLILPDITNPFFPELAKACEELAQSLGYAINMINTNDNEGRMADAVTQIREARVDGLIITSAAEGNKELLSKLLEEGYPVVLVHRRIQGLAVDTVVADNFTGGYSAARHLLSLGHTRIAMLTGVAHSPVIMKRLEGYMKAMQDAGVTIQPEWVTSGYGKYELSFHATENLMRLPESKRPTAMVASNDISALGVMDAAEHLGICIPEELSLVGFDDLFFSAMKAVQLTTVRIPRYEMGQMATRLLIDRISRSGPPHPIEMVLPTTLIIRKTCGATNNTFISK